MGHENRGEHLLAPDLFQQLLHLQPGQRVEGAQRLVQQEQPGMGDEGAGERHALALAA